MDHVESEDDRDWGALAGVTRFWNRLNTMLMKKRNIGIVYENEVEGGGNSYVVFKPNQIKSATDNTGAFDAGNDDIRFSLSPIKDADANIRRGRETLAKAITDKTSVHRAMFRNGLGWVDFVWGDEGRVTPSGKSRGAMGLAHIMEARQRKDGMSQQQVMGLLDRIVRAIAKGRELRRYSFGPTEKLVLEQGGVEATLARSKGSNAWLLSGWEVKTPSSAARAGYVAPSATASVPTTARQAGEEGDVPAAKAAGSASIGQNATNSKPRFDLAGGNKDA